MKINNLAFSLLMYAFIMLVLFVFCGQALAGGTPHVIYGKVFSHNGSAPNNVEMYAYTPLRPLETLDKSSTGSGYSLFTNGEGWLCFEVGNYSYLWSINESLRVIVIDTVLGESGVTNLILDRSGNQLLPDLHLQHGDNVGPIAHHALVDGESPVSIPAGTKTVKLTATVDDSIAGNSNIQACEYFVDTDPGVGFGIGMSPSDGLFNSAKEEVFAFLNTSSWTRGSTHIVYARGQDSANNWGIVHMAVVSVTKPIRGDIDVDGDVDMNDLNIILAARNKPATGPDDPRDLDGDGMITGLDARILVTLCTRPRCATQ